MTGNKEINFFKAIKQEVAAQSALARALDKAIAAFGPTRLVSSLAPAKTTC